MKKIIAVVLTLCMAVSFCGGLVPAKVQAAAKTVKAGYDTGNWSSCAKPIGKGTTKVVHTFPDYLHGYIYYEAPETGTYTIKISGLKVAGCKQNSVDIELERYEKKSGGYFPVDGESGISFPYTEVIDGKKYKYDAYFASLLTKSMLGTQYESETAKASLTYKAKLKKGERAYIKVYSLINYINPETDEKESLKGKKATFTVKITKK